METFSTLLALCAGNSPVTGEFASQRPATRSFDVFFDLHLNKQLSKQSGGWWFEMPSRSLWRHGNEQEVYCLYMLPDAMISWLSSSISWLGYFLYCCPNMRTRAVIGGNFDGKYHSTPRIQVTTHRNSMVRDLKANDGLTKYVQAMVPLNINKNKANEYKKLSWVEK